MNLWTLIKQYIVQFSHPHQQTSATRNISLTSIIFFKCLYSIPLRYYPQQLVHLLVAAFQKLHVQMYDNVVACSIHYLYTSQFSQHSFMIVLSMYPVQNRKTSSRLLLLFNSEISKASLISGMLSSSIEIIIQNKILVYKDIFLA